MQILSFTCLDCLRLSRYRRNFICRQKEFCTPTEFPFPADTLVFLRTETSFCALFGRAGGAFCGQLVSNLINSHVGLIPFRCQIVPTGDGLSQFRSVGCGFAASNRSLAGEISLSLTHGSPTQLCCGQYPSCIRCQRRDLPPPHTHTLPLPLLHQNKTSKTNQRFVKYLTLAHKYEYQTVY